MGANIQFRHLQRGRMRAFIQARSFPVWPLTWLLASSTAFADWESTILPRDFKTESTLSSALATAKQTGRDVIVYYTRTRCPPCEVLQGRLRNESVAKPFRESYVFTVVWGSSMGLQEREDYRQRFAVDGAPTWIVFNSAGSYICTSSGGFSSDEGGSQLHAVVQKRLAAIPATATPLKATACAS